MNFIDIFKGKKIGVVIPCYNEERNIITVLSKCPDYVSKIYVINDCSTDNTLSKILSFSIKDNRVIILNHETNQGVGKSLQTGYEQSCLDENDVTVVVAGDDQMDQELMHLLILPVVENKADYAKANRLFFYNQLHKIPKKRLFGNLILSFLTRIATGYWLSGDSQTGYTAINLKYLKLLLKRDLYPKYGVPNDILINLSLNSARVLDIPMNPVYGVGEISKLKPYKVIFPITRILLKGFFKRMLYVHTITYSTVLPLAYISLLLVCLGIVIYIPYILFFNQFSTINSGQFLTIIFLLVTGFFGAMLTLIMDMIFEFKRLYKN